MLLGELRERRFILEDELFMLEWNLEFGQDEGKEIKDIKAQIEDIQNEIILRLERLEETPIVELAKRLHSKDCTVAVDAYFDMDDTGEYDKLVEQIDNIRM